MLTSALQVPNEFFSFAPVNGKQSASVVVAGTVFDSKGNPGGAFSNRLTIDSISNDSTKPGGDLTYGFPILVKPGLYQVRVGVRDEATGRSGTRARLDRDSESWFRRVGIKQFVGGPANTTNDQ